MAASVEQSPIPGATLVSGGVRFVVRSATATGVWVCIFDGEGGRERERHQLTQGGEFFSATVQGLGEGCRYGLRADGPYDTERGNWFDPEKLLVDPYAVEIDRPYRYDARLAAPRGHSGDTAALVPKAVVRAPLPEVTGRTVSFRCGGLIYEASVRALTMRHPEIPENLRGTIAAVAHPAIVDHLKRLGVSAIELMPVTAWIDERHLAPLGLTNAWGYNPVTFMALDPRLAPGGIGELRHAVASLRAQGIGVILDLVFNHTGESDAQGPTLSLRGLDNLTAYRHVEGEPLRLVNDTGTGNTVACERPVMRALILASLRHFVLQAGVDGFRFDLAPVLGRTDHGFDANAELFRDIADDPVLADRVMIAEPWDIGPGGYQLGNFPANYLEWNDRYRDDVRRFWRGDGGTMGTLATRLAGSSDVFASSGRQTRTVNFLAAHDGMSLTDTVSYAAKHNEANGESNRDGHGDNLSWNNGVEGRTDDQSVNDARHRDLRALLATLFASRGTIMLTAGDEFGRTQRGNNNAYAQDNETTWLDWEGRDTMLESLTCRLSAMRRRYESLTRTAWLSGQGEPPDVEWLDLAARPLSTADWDDGRRQLTMVLSDDRGRIAVLINGDEQEAAFRLPAGDWRRVDGEAEGGGLPSRSVAFFATY